MALDDVEIVKSETAIVMNLKPERVVSSYSFAIKVDGVENISAIVCHVSGLNGGYFLGKRMCIPAEAPVCVETDCKTECYGDISRISCFRKVLIHVPITRWC